MREHPFKVSGVAAIQYKVPELTLAFDWFSHLVKPILALNLIGANTYKCAYNVPQAHYRYIHEN